MGIVYRAIDTKLDREVALKTTLKTSDDGAERFLRELKTAAKLNHQNIVQVYDWDADDDRCYFVMELLAGGQSIGSWRQRHSEQHTEPRLDVVADLFCMAADALWYIHASGFIHRDIKPSNILLGQMAHHQGLVAKISDFGVVSAFDSDLTATGQAVGTANVQSPEVVRYYRGEDVTLDARVDVWALVVALCECLTGARPFCGRGMVETHDAILNHQPTWPSEVRTDIELGKHLDHICRKGLEKDPELRYQSAQELHQDLLRLDELPAYSGPNATSSDDVRGSSAGGPKMIVMPQLGKFQFPGDTVDARRPTPAAKDNEQIPQNAPQGADIEHVSSAGDVVPLHDASPGEHVARMPRRTLVPAVAMAAVAACVLLVALGRVASHSEPQSINTTLSKDDVQEPVRQVSYHELIAAEKRARQTTLLASNGTRTASVAPMTPQHAIKASNQQPTEPPKKDTREERSPRRLRPKTNRPATPARRTTADGIEILPRVSARYSFSSNRKPKKQNRETPTDKRTASGLKPSPRPCLGRLDLTWTSQANAPAFVVLEQACGSIPKGSRLRGTVTYELAATHAQVEITYRQITLPTGERRSVHAITYSTHDEPGLSIPIEWKDNRLPSEGKETGIDILQELAGQTRWRGAERLLGEQRSDAQRGRQRWAIVELDAGMQLKVLILEVAS